MTNNISTITPQELENLRKSGQPIELIDVRSPVEYREYHATPARNVPLDKLDPKTIIESRKGSQDAPLYIICKSGNRGEKAFQQFDAMGYTQVVNIEGGTQAWQEAGLPITRGQKTMSLERQVRITAGMLVLIGATLSWLVHPAFIGLSFFVGAGLVFAGITDSCAMGMMLAKMPWNQVSQQCEKSPTSA